MYKALDLEEESFPCYNRIRDVRLTVSETDRKQVLVCGLFLGEEKVPSPWRIAEQLSPVDSLDRQLQLTRRIPCAVQTTNCGAHRGSGHDMQRDILFFQNLQDADVRRPMQQSLFKLPVGPGFTDLFRVEAAFNTPPLH